MQCFITPFVITIIIYVISMTREDTRRHQKNFTRNIAVALESSDFSFSSKHWAFFSICHWTSFMVPSKRIPFSICFLFIVLNDEAGIVCALLETKSFSAAWIRLQSSQQNHLSFGISCRAIPKTNNKFFHLKTPFNLLSCGY